MHVHRRVEVVSGKQVNASLHSIFGQTRGVVSDDVRCAVFVRWLSALAHRRSSPGDSINGRSSVTIASCRNPVAVPDILHAARLFAYDKIDVPCCLMLAVRGGTRAHPSSPTATACFGGLMPKLFSQTSSIPWLIPNVRNTDNSPRQTSRGSTSLGCALSQVASCRRSS